MNSEGFDIGDRFRLLDRLLVESESLWAAPGFEDAASPLLPREALYRALEQLSEEQVQDFERNEGHCEQWLKPLMPELPDLISLIQMPCLTSARLCVPRGLEMGVPGRKWEQVLAFAGAIETASATGGLVEWCSGKGYLGNLLSATGCESVTSLDFDEALCTSGQQRAHRLGLAQRFCRADVMSQGVVDYFAGKAGAVGLHACGDLHRRLLEVYAQEKLSQLYLAPCCYHLTRSDHYQPMSEEAAESPLRLSRQLLKFSVQGLATGGLRAERLRHRQLWWRMSFDEWQRSVRGVSEYLPLPAVPGAVLSGGFQSFIDWACRSRSLPLMPGRDHHKFLARGQERALWVRRLELITRSFRRPLELWLLLDRALYLQESGADVRVGTFCDAALTPRNLMITASRTLSDLGK